jgi:hypothetical protein
VDAHPHMRRRIRSVPPKVAPGTTTQSVLAGVGHVTTKQRPDRGAVQLGALVLGSASHTTPPPTAAFQKVFFYERINTACASGARPAASQPRQAHRCGAQHSSRMECLLCRRGANGATTTGQTKMTSAIRREVESSRRTAAGERCSGVAQGAAAPQITFQAGILRERYESIGPLLSAPMSTGRTHTWRLVEQNR